MSGPKPYTKTRIFQSVSHNGKWVVQGWWPDSQVWGDIGDPCDTYADAQRKLNEMD